ncbi:hypothetical protein [Aquimarina muelleri]|uniref:BioF2-like acetyltransferase domain-containing protein n=1 Tax=Aquimarina muelleri TaxID=279356 RepID=A0A918N3S0_9FLAO|nr:hypothetical protein [Aquimarina muelleri]MCX2761776.1 hypothetical protein [Aquimarina muelleri]GGX16105.1 hypothetical protein GCM10007384_17070 [Aquimarina muelleri]
MVHKLNNKYKNIPLRYVFYNHINDIPNINWDLVNPKKNIFLSLSYLKTLERTLSETISFRYILFYDKNTPVGFATTQLIKFNPEQLKLQGFPCRISDTIKNTLLKNTEVGVLICGNLFSCGEHGFVYNSNLVSSRMIYDSLSNALKEIRKSKNSNKPSFILLKEFWPTSFSQSDYSKKHDFREFKIDVNMVLKIHSDWHTFEDYLTSLKTKFRTRAKNVFKKSENIIIKDFTSEDISTYKNEINILYLSVIEKADFKIEKLNASTFKSLKKELKDSFIFTGYFLEQKLVGFTTSFIQDNTIEANHIGIDYNYNTKYAIYQKMLYNYVTLAISKNAEELRLGRTAETIKSSVGAKPVDMKLYVRHGNSISNTLLKPLIELISPNEYEIRNPFKLQSK